MRTLFVLTIIGVLTFAGRRSRRHHRLERRPDPDRAVGADTINGMGGRDLIRGLGGNDILSGDTGPDTVDAGPATTR